MCSMRSLLVLLALAACSHHALAQELTAEECVPLGFTGEAGCSDCDTMAEYVADEELLADCRRCCVPDQKKYASARLEVCPYRLSGLPAIKDFIDKHRKQFGSAVTVAERVGAYPKLVLGGGPGAGGGKGKAKSTSVRVDNWKVAQLVEFLRQKLEAPPAKA